jgi:hypothetical protein
VPLFFPAAVGPSWLRSRSSSKPAEVGFNRADPDAASLAELAEPARHHIGRFSTPQKGYFASILLAERF